MREKDQWFREPDPWAERQRIRIGVKGDPTPDAEYKDEPPRGDSNG